LLESLETAADLSDVPLVTVEALVAARRVRVERVGGERKVRVDDIFTATAEALGPPAPAPLSRRLADRRRRRAVAGEMPLRFEDGDGAGESGAR
jgi:hypothetical protein